MLDWNDLHHFVVLAREGTLSAAARALGVDHVTVARRVAALEASTALKLVDRRARSYALTEDGRRIAAVASSMEEAAFGVERAMQAAKPGISGEVSISAPPSLANALVAPKLVVLRRQHPGILIKLIGEKRSASLTRREADIALRLSRPSEPGLIARRIGHFGSAFMPRRRISRRRRPMPLLLSLTTPAWTTRHNSNGSRPSPADAASCSAPAILKIRRRRRVPAWAWRHCRTSWRRRSTA